MVSWLDLTTKNGDLMELHYEQWDVHGILWMKNLWFNEWEHGFEHVRRLSIPLKNCQVMILFHHFLCFAGINCFLMGIVTWWYTRWYSSRIPHGQPQMRGACKYMGESVRNIAKPLKWLEISHVSLNGTSEGMVPWQSKFTKFLGFAQVTFL